MPKRIAVIDTGSNSARLVIYQRTSRYAVTVGPLQPGRERHADNYGPSPC